MAKLQFLNGETSRGMFRVFIQDTSSSTGAGLTGLTFATASLRINLIADNEATATTYVGNSTIQSIATIGTFVAPSSGQCRFKEMDSTNLPGWYEVQVLDARWAVSGSRAVQCNITVTGGFCAPLEFQLAAVNLNDSAAGGMSRLDAAISSRAVAQTASPYYGTIVRRATDVGNLYFEWTSAAGTITVTKSVSGAAYTAATGVASYLRTDGSTYIWQLGYAAADRPASGTVVYQLTDGVTTRFLPLYVDVDSPQSGDSFARIGSGGVNLTQITTLPNSTETAIKAKTDNLPASPAATGDAMALTSAERSAIWGVSTASMSTIGSIGLLLKSDITGDIYTRLGAPIGASIAADIASIYGRIPSVLVSGMMNSYVSGGVQTLANATELAIKAKTDNLPSDPASASTIATSFSTVNSTLATIAGYIDTEVAAILAKVTNLPVDPADASDIAASFSSIAATLATLATSVQAAAIKAKTDSLTFTKALELDVNIQSVNDVTVTGDGTVSTPWGP